MGIALHIVAAVCREQLRLQSALQCLGGNLQFDSPAGSRGAQQQAQQEFQSHIYLPFASAGALFSIVEHGSP